MDKIEGLEIWNMAVFVLIGIGVGQIIAAKDILDKVKQDGL